MDELLFFAKKPDALPLYVQLRSMLLEALACVEIQVKKTQISFRNRRLFAAVSFTPVRKAKDRPAAFITVTFGLPRRLDSARIDAAVEPYPGRWTHHVMIGSVSEMDGEFTAWLSEAAAFASTK